jgi:hypothetical protein
MMASGQLQDATPLEHASAVGMDVKPPPLVALFLIVFDLKIGYTISWKQALNDGKL